MVKVKKPPPINLPPSSLNKPQIQNYDNRDCGKPAKKQPGGVHISLTDFYIKNTTFAERNFGDQGMRF